MFPSSLKLRTLFACALLVITACQPAASAPAPPLSERDLSQIICRNYSALSSVAP